MLMEIALIVLGLLLLVGGGEFLVKGGVGLARRFGVSPMMIGVTIIAYGTSTPELVVSVDAAMAGSPGIAVGNVVGSNIYNIMAILGVSALIKPTEIPQQIINSDMWVMLGATLLLVAVCAITKRISRLWGGIFIALAVGYTYSLFLFMAAA